MGGCHLVYLSTDAGTVRLLVLPEDKMIMGAKCSYLVQDMEAARTGQLKTPRKEDCRAAAGSGEDEGRAQSGPGSVLGSGHRQCTFHHDRSVAYLTLTMELGHHALDRGCFSSQVR